MKTKITLALIILLAIVGCGRIEKTMFEFSELIALNKYETTVEDSKVQVGHKEIFKGLFFVSDFNKPIRGETYIMPDKAERLFGKNRSIVSI